MQPLINVGLTFLIGFMPFVFVVFFVAWLRKRQSTKAKHPISSDLMRGPGQAIVEQIEDINIELMAYLSTIIYAPLFFYSLYLQSNQSTATLWLFLIAALGTLAFLILRLVKLVNKKSNLSLGYDAEQAVGQELNLLMQSGYRVFHDLQADNHNVDHVVVGKTGVFAVETKGRSKRLNNAGKYDYRLVFDGEKLHFPSWVETEPVQQARRQASSLQAELNRAVGAHFKVNPVLAIPGWFVEAKVKTDVLLINGKKCQHYFDAVKQDKLDDSLIERIVYQLEQRCRNVSAQSYNANAK